MVDFGDNLPHLLLLLLRRQLAVSSQLSLSAESVSAAYPSEPLFVAPAATVGEVLQLLRAQKRTSVLICEGDRPGHGQLLGIFTERDALIWVAARKDLNEPITSAMSRDPESLQSSTSVGEAVKMMAKGKYRRLPILAADGTPQGLASARGIVQYLVDHFPQTVYNLPPNPKPIQSEREGA